MILKIANNLYVGTEEGLIFTNKNTWSIIHLSQKYHYKIMRWNYKNLRPDKSHPNYLIYKKDEEISVNLVDGPSHLFEPFGVKGFNYLLDFINKSIKNNRSVFIHCDRGKSRSPSLALLYLSKKTNYFKYNDYTYVHREFSKIYPQYNPGGITNFLKLNWKYFN